MKFYFYSVPGSTTPSPYWFSYRRMLAHLSRQGILQFKTWQGTHDAPEPVTDTGWHSVHDVNAQEEWVRAHIAKETAVDESYFRTHICGVFLNEPWPIRTEIGAQV